MSKIDELRDILCSEDKEEHVLLIEEYARFIFEHNLTISYLCVEDEYDPFYKDAVLALKKIKDSIRYFELGDSAKAIDLLYEYIALITT